MISANLTFVRIYQFIAEALLLYFFLVPFYYFRGLPLPFLSFIIAVVGTTILLFVLTRVSETYIPILIYVPIAITGFLVMGYDLFLAIAMAVYFSWRFIRHLQEEGMEHEFKLMLTGLFIVLFESLIITELALYAVLSLQIVVLVFGHMLSHVVSIQISNSNQKPFMQVGVIGVFFLLITGISYSAYEGLERMINGTLSALASVFSFVFLGIVNFLDFLGINIASIEQLSQRISESQEEELKLGEMENQSFDEMPKEPGVQNAGETIYWSFLSIVVIVAVIIAIILIRKKVMNKRQDRLHEEPSVNTKWMTKEGSSLRDKLSDFFGRRKPENPVRQMFFDFERFASKKGFGRKNYETIEDWFQRLGVKDANVEVYQKVRYGDETSLNESEVEQFKQDLQQLRQALIEQSQGNEH